MQMLDWIAIILFLATWVGLEPMMALGWPRRTDSLMLDMVRIRQAWMREVLTRDTNFIGDAAILGHTINATDVPLCLIGLKLIRTVEAPDYSDNSDDIEGYLDIFRKIVGDDMIHARSVKEYLEKREGRK